MVKRITCRGGQAPGLDLRWMLPPFAHNSVGKDSFDALTRGGWLSRRGRNGTLNHCYDILSSGHLRPAPPQLLNSCVPISGQVSTQPDSQAARYLHGTGFPEWNEAATSRRR